MATGSWEHSAKIWNAATGHALRKLEGGQPGYVNSVEFWSGRNPMAMGPEMTDSGDRLAMELRPDGAVDATVRRADGSEQHYTVVREPGAISAYDESGGLVARTGARD